MSYYLIIVIFITDYYFIDSREMWENVILPSGGSGMLSTGASMWVASVHESVCAG